jgi:hypothetical protein
MNYWKDDGSCTLTLLLVGTQKISDAWCLLHKIMNAGLIIHTKSLITAIQTAQFGEHLSLDLN